MSTSQIAPVYPDITGLPSVGTPKEVLEEFVEDLENFEVPADKKQDENSPYSNSEIKDPSTASIKISIPPVPYEANKSSPYVDTRDNRSLNDRVSKICKDKGIEPYPEYSDILTRYGFESKAPVSDRDITMFIMGIVTDRRYSITTNLREITQKLETSLKLVINYDRKLQEKLEREEGQVLAHLKSMGEDIKGALERTKAEPQVSTDPREEWQQSKRKTPIVFLSKLGPKVDYDSAVTANYEALGMPPSDPDPIVVAATKLSWGEETGRNQLFRESFIRMIPMSVKIALHYDLLTQDALSRVRDILTPP